jgi:hypothetical protein
MPTTLKTYKFDYWAFNHESFKYLWRILPAPDYLHLATPKASVYMGLDGRFLPNLKHLRLSGKAFGDSDAWIHRFASGFPILEHLRFPLILSQTWESEWPRLKLLEVDAHVHTLSFFKDKSSAFRLFRWAIEKKMFPALKKLHIRAVAYSPTSKKTLYDVMTWETEGPLIRTSCAALGIELEVDPHAWYDEETALMLQ